MIEIRDIEKLADLARLEVPDSEKEALRKDLDSILGYVAQIKDAHQKGTDVLDVTPLVHTAFREDGEGHEGGIYSQELLREVPHREGNYVKVKKILS